jgi:ABC-type uncharacterized transport system YnjBCD ATPase subunit
VTLQAGRLPFADGNLTAIEAEARKLGVQWQDSALKNVSHVGCPLTAATP